MVWSAMRLWGFLAVTAAVVACGDRPAAPVPVEVVPVPDTVVPNDGRAPTIDLRLIDIDDTTARIEGTISDTNGVKLISLDRRRPTADGNFNFNAIIPIAYTPGRHISLNVPLPSQPWGPFFLRVRAFDTFGNWTEWQHEWVPVVRHVTITNDSRPRDATLHHAGLDFTISVVGPADLDSISVLVDSGTAHARRYQIPRLWFALRPFPYDTVRTTDIAVPADLPNGPHHFVVRVFDHSGGSTADAFDYAIDVPDVIYRVSVVGPPGARDSYALGVSATGDVAGKATFGDGVDHAFARRGLSYIALAGAADASSAAVAIDSLGETLGYIDSIGIRARTWSAGGAVRSLFAFPRRPLALTETRLVLFEANVPGFNRSPTLVDLGTGITTPLPFANAAGVNRKGQAVSATDFDGITIKASQTTVAMPKPRWILKFPFALGIDDSAGVLGSTDSEMFYARNTSAQFLTQFLPAGTCVLAPDGTIASFAGPDSITLWSEERGSRHVRLIASSWTVDSISAMNARGDIVGHGINRVTGERAAVMLVPFNPITGAAANRRR